MLSQDEDADTDDTAVMPPPSSHHDVPATPKRPAPFRDSINGFAALRGQTHSSHVTICKATPANLMAKAHTLLELAADSIEYSGRRYVEYVSNNHAPTMQAWCPGLVLNSMAVRPGTTQTIAIIATKPGSQQFRITNSSYKHVPAPLLSLFASQGHGSAHVSTDPRQLGLLLLDARVEWRDYAKATRNRKSPIDDLYRDRGAFIISGTPFFAHYLGLSLHTQTRAHVERPCKRNDHFKAEWKSILRAVHSETIKLMGPIPNWPTGRQDQQNFGLRLQEAQTSKLLNMMNDERARRKIPHMALSCQLEVLAFRASGFSLELAEYGDDGMLRSITAELITLLGTFPDEQEFDKRGVWREMPSLAPGPNPPHHIVIDLDMLRRSGKNNALGAKVGEADVALTRYGPHLVKVLASGGSEPFSTLTLVGPGAGDGIAHTRGQGVVQTVSCFPGEQYTRTRADIPLIPPLGLIDGDPHAYTRHWTLEEIQGLAPTQRRQFFPWGSWTEGTSNKYATRYKLTHPMLGWALSTIALASRPQFTQGNDHHQVRAEYGRHVGGPRATNTQEIFEGDFRGTGARTYNTRARPTPPGAVKRIPTRHHTRPILISKCQVYTNPSPSNRGLVRDVRNAGHAQRMILRDVRGRADEKGTT